MPSKRRSISRPSSCSPSSSSRRKRARVGCADPASDDNCADMRDQSYQPQPPMSESPVIAPQSALLPSLPPSPSRDGKDTAPSTPIWPPELGHQEHVYDDQQPSEADNQSDEPTRSSSPHDPFSMAWSDVPVVYPFRRTEQGSWMPPYEPDRPKNPYRKGFKTTIYRHEPPLNDLLVDENDYVGPTPGIKDDRNLHLKTLVDACLSSAICKGTTFEEQSHQFEVVDEIAVRTTHGAQIVVCKLDGQTKSYVAKIYDPLYYSFRNQELPHMPRSTTAQADRDYCNEANVYAGLQHTSLAGNEIPAYHGSFTFDIELDLPEPRGRYMRPVRLIIMEYVEGAKTMENIDPSSLPASLRLDIMAQLSAASIAIKNCNVFHNDVCPRNTLIRLPGAVKQEKDGDEQGDALPLRVVIFDFNISEYLWKPKQDRVWNDRGEQEYVLEPIEFWPNELPRHPTRIDWNDIWEFDGLYRRWWPRSWRKTPSVGRWNAWLLKHHAATPVWKAIWDCLMAAEGPLEPSKEPIAEDLLGPEEDEAGEDSPSENDGEEYDSEGYEQEVSDDEPFDRDEHDMETYNMRAYEREVKGRAAYDREAYGKKADDQEAYGREADEQEAVDKEADDREAYEEDNDESKQDEDNSDAKRKVQQMSTPLPESSTSPPENGQDTTHDDSTPITPEAIVKGSVDQHSVSAHEEVVGQDGPCPSASAEIKEHDGPEPIDNKNGSGQQS
ncbi:hypothetical protein MCOR34_007338 [Pyricularia oryzae]|nr:hypothetical protein MCOR34_007338 [Pyricularia oryzae]